MQIDCVENEDGRRMAGKFSSLRFQRLFAKGEGWKQRTLHFTAKCLMLHSAARDKL